MITKKNIYEEVMSLKSSIEAIHDRQNDLANIMKRAFDYKEIKNAIEGANQKFSDIVDGIKQGQLRVQSMTNELKGVVSMARASLDEGRKLSDMLALPRFCDDFAMYLLELSRYLDRLGSTVNRMQAYVVKEENLELNKELEK